MSLSYGRDVTVAVGEADGRAYVDVIDSGPGVPEDRIETLFLPFTHANSVAGQPGTTGLGFSPSPSPFDAR